MKRKHITISEDLHRELLLTSRLYPTSIHKLANAAIQYALMHKLPVWGFGKKDEKALEE